MQRHSLHRSMKRPHRPLMAQRAVFCQHAISIGTGERETGIPDHTAIVSNRFALESRGRKIGSVHHHLLDFMGNILNSPLKQKGTDQLNNLASTPKRNRQKTSENGEDPLMLLMEIHRRGIAVDINIIIPAMSACADRGTLDEGTQLHTLLLKSGFEPSVFVGSSLIRLYSRCLRLNCARRVFLAMPAKNTVLWTVIIAGYARDNKVEPCFELFIMMMRSSCEPNDFTFTSLLSACTARAYLGLGRTIHALAMIMGFDLHIHVSNALVSMYAKCGEIEESWSIFAAISRRDLFSWNSMIFGCAQYGLARQCLQLLKEMRAQRVKPDAISFLGALSSCRHAGLVDEGRDCFDLMVECGVEPEIDHYSCIIDLLGHAGLITDAWDLIQRMPVRPNAVIWGSLLSACRVHRNVRVGIWAAEHRLTLEPGCSATYIQLANLYASAGNWSDVARVRKLMKERGLKTNPGRSWIEVGNTVFEFRVEDMSGVELKEMLRVFDQLHSHMIDESESFK